jgi:hypothetical protein
MFALNTCRARGIASESRNMYANTSCEWSRFTCKTVATTGSLRSEGEANTTVYSNGKAPTRDIISEEAVSDKRWSATAGEVAGFSQIGTATHRWVKMGSDRVQTMQMQAASGRGIRLLYAYVHGHLCRIVLQQAVTCQLDFVTKNIHTRVLGACPRVLETCISSYPLSISRPARSPRPRPRGDKLPHFASWSQR